MNKSKIAIASICVLMSAVVFTSISLSADGISYAEFKAQNSGQSSERDSEHDSGHDSKQATEHKPSKSTKTQTNHAKPSAKGTTSWPNVHSNVLTDFNPATKLPQIQQSAFIHPFGIVIGDCSIGKMVLVAPTAVCRGDEGTPIHVEDYSNMQDGVVLHGLETTQDGKNLDDRRFSKDGKRLKANDPKFSDGYSIYVGKQVSLAHGSLVHGPAWIGDDTFVGMMSMVFNAKVGSNVAIGVASVITGGVEIPDNKFVPPGTVITTQEQADSLPSRVGSPYENINKAVIHVNENLAEKYDEQGLEKIIQQRESQMEKGMMETGSHQKQSEHKAESDSHSKKENKH